MKTIEIKTTQNVTLEYELADLRDRIVAFLIDLVVLIFGISVLSVGFSTFNSQTAIVIYSTLLVCIFIFYSPALEMLNNGQSLGKMVMKIRVIKMTGARAELSDYAARWAFRLIDIYFSMGGIASVLIASSGKAQRIGDIVANTAVIKTGNSMDLKLADILSIQSRESYTPVYLEAKQLMEEDVLLIKETLTRYQKYQNESHREAIRQLASQIMNVLSIKSISGNERQFLQTILQDYVVLTR